ncbi:MAG TPA: hypothetical protein VNZ26_17705, partial [Vicinamibacterales bacterium]|nr:hypothetical protein [Vicinamibacterales bacterium]
MLSTKLPRECRTALLDDYQRTSALLAAGSIDPWRVQQESLLPTSSVLHKTRLVCEPINTRPEGTHWAVATHRVVDAFLMGTTDDPVRADAFRDTVFMQEADDLVRNCWILARVTRIGRPRLDCNGIALVGPLEHRDGEL